MRQRRLGVWLAVVVAITTALGVGSHASGVRWEVTLEVAPAGVELAAATEHARIALKL